MTNITVEKYPLGKILFLEMCKLRGFTPERAMLDWLNWEEDFLTKDEWQKLAVNFLVEVNQ